jgi:hypothetical protein
MSVIYDEVYKLAQQLSENDQVRLIDALLENRHTPDNQEDIRETVEPEYTDSEVAELMQVEPLSGAEIVARGLTGMWADLEIDDSLSWLEGQREKQRRNYTW